MKISMLASLVLAVSLCGSVSAEPGYQDAFDLDGCAWSSTGKNPYFVLEPGFRLLLEGKEAGRAVTLQITVLDETKLLGGVETRVVEERETVSGEIREVSRNYFAICRGTGSVYYFGEDVDIYRKGAVVGHEGAWLHGQAGARAGLMMPGEPLPGARYVQEIAPGVAADRAEIVETDATIATPAGTFRRCLKVREENPLEKGREIKVHAPGVGLIQDEDLRLVSYGFVNG